MSFPIPPPSISLPPVSKRAIQEPAQARGIRSLRQAFVRPTRRSLGGPEGRPSCQLRSSSPDEELCSSKLRGIGRGRCRRPGAGRVKLRIL